MPLEQAIVERRRQAVDDVEDPDEGGDADEQRHGDEESGDEAATDPLHGYSQPAAIAAKIATPAAIRYQANGANPERLTNSRNGLITTSDARNAATSPMRDLEPAVRRQLMPDLQQIVRERRDQRRHREKERELRGGRAVEAHRHAADDRRARARHAGNERQRLAEADAERARHRACARRPE